MNAAEAGPAKTPIPATRIHRPETGPELEITEARPSRPSGERRRTSGLEFSSKYKEWISRLGRLEELKKLVNNPDSREMTDFSNQLENIKSLVARRGEQEQKIRRLKDEYNKLITDNRDNQARLDNTQRVNDLIEIMVASNLAEPSYDIRFDKKEMKKYFERLKQRPATTTQEAAKTLISPPKSSEGLINASKSAVVTMLEPRYMDALDKREKIPLDLNQRYGEIEKEIAEIEKFIKENLDTAIQETSNRFDNLTGIFEDNLTTARKSKPTGLAEAA